MNLLAIETATEACSAALLSGTSVSQRFEFAPRRHAELILPMIDSLLDEAGLALGRLDAIAFGRGPGAFTGVRIAAGVAQGLAYGAGLPVVPVSSLAALAQGAARESARIAAAIDARMGEIYCAQFVRGGDGLVDIVTVEQVIAPGDFPVPAGSGWLGVGSGWAAHGTLLRKRFGGALRECDGERYPAAADLALLAAREVREGRTVDAGQALPVYLRDPISGGG
jgi:tRNA threonylcarbamoyladenosine biosynthesis protein TsaB